MNPAGERRAAASADNDPDRPVPEEAEA